jgi:hypothetical protein
VARITLSAIPAFQIRLQDSADRPGNFSTVPTYYIGIQLVVAPKDADDDWRPTEQLPLDRKLLAIIDTGTPLTIIPYQFWQPFAQQIDVLADASDESELIVAGGKQNGKLARIRLGAIDDDLNWMAARSTLTLLLDAPKAGDPPDKVLRVPLLGLQSHFFTHRRRLCHVGSHRDERLMTVPQWRLEDPPRWRPW